MERESNKKNNSVCVKTNLDETGLVNVENLSKIVGQWLAIQSNKIKNLTKDR